MFTFLGLVRVSFTNEETGELIQGWQLWCGEPAAAPSVGIAPVKKWLTDEMYESLIMPLGGAAGIAKYAGREVQLILSLRGAVRGISFPQK